MGNQQYEIISIKEFIKNPENCTGNIFVGKTAKSYLLGPKVNNNFSFESFYRRLISSMLYEKNTYKNFKYKEIKKLLEEHIDEIKYNTILEYYKNGEYKEHKLQDIPGIKKGRYNSALKI